MPFVYHCMLVVAINTTKSQATGKTPTELMFGCVPPAAWEKKTDATTQMQDESDPEALDPDEDEEIKLDTGSSDEYTEAVEAGLESECEQSSLDDDQANGSDEEGEETSDSESKADLEAEDDDTGLGDPADRHYAARKVAKKNILKAAEVNLNKRLNKGRNTIFVVGDLVGVLFPTRIRKQRGVVDRSVPGLVVEVKEHSYRVR